MTLQQYLMASAARPFEWGGHDCATFAADWAAIVSGQPVAPPHVPSALACARLVQEMPMIEIARRILAPAGFACVAGGWQDGDIGVIEADGRQGMAIYSGGAWAVLAAGQGVGLIEADPVLVMRAVI